MAKGISEIKGAAEPSKASLAPLAAVLGEVGVPHACRVLILGGGAAGRKQLAPVLSARTGPIFVIDPDVKDDDRVTRTGADPFSSELPDKVDLCVAMPALARMPDAVEGLLYGGICDSLNEGGIAVVPLPRDVTDKTLIAQGATLSRVRAGLQTFLKYHFGTEEIGSPGVVAEKFADDPDYEFVALASRTRPSFAADPIVWLILRKRAVRARTDRTRAFPRTPRPEQFLLSELEAFVCAMKNAGIALLPVSGFSKRYVEYCARRTRRRKQAEPFGHIKFDIHGNVRRALEIATMLHKHAIPGLFLMMHRHPLNQDFFDSPSTWRMLHDIEAMGHEVGIHADPFCLIREKGDLQVGLRAAVKDLRERGFRIRAITLHGDTREHIKARQLQANDFFREKFRRTKWDGKPPEGEEELANHTYQYSYRRIANSLDLPYFPEVNFLHKGRLLTKEPMLYVSDNARAIRLNSIPAKISPRETMSAKKPFVIDPEFITEAVNVLRQRPFLALFHPQWYW